MNNALTLCITYNNAVPLATLLTLTQCALESDDMPLWVETIRACGVVEHPGRLPVLGFVGAIDSFGFDTLREMWVITVCMQSLLTS